MAAIRETGGVAARTQHGAGGFAREPPRAGWLLPGAVATVASPPSPGPAPEAAPRGVGREPGRDSPPAPPRAPSLVSRGRWCWAPWPGLKLKGGETRRVHRMSSLSDRFPLHDLVWKNDYRQLEKALENQQDVDQTDPRGRTSLHLAVSLGYIESARVLLSHKADVTKENAQGWTVLHEAVSTGDPEMVHMILQHRNYQQTSATLGGVPELLQKIKETPDFYVEMKWEFTTWVPLLSRLCPSDVCRIWKSGTKLRVDITLLEFKNMSWGRGKRSLIFRGEETGHWAELIEVNHDEKVVATEHFEISRQIKCLTLDAMSPESKEVERRLTSPILSTSLDTKNIAFERNMSGFLVWRTERSEVVNDYEAKVYTANNVNMVTKVRTEHLTEEEKRRYREDRHPLEFFLGTIQHEYGAQQDLTTEYATANNPTAITPEEYFNPAFDLKDRDVGRPKEVAVQTRKFKANLWMSEEFPLSLVEQVSPIIDLMARTSAHFARLKDFITLDFPPGFPVKIEIPLFHIVNAQITFGNVNACSTAEEAAPQALRGSQQRQPSASAFVVDQSVFEVPKSYHAQDDGRNIRVQDEDNEILQFAIQQSLMESRCSREALGTDSNGAASYSQDLDLQYQRALQESFRASSSPAAAPPRESASLDRDLQLALALSVQDQKELEQQRQAAAAEAAELEEALQRSLLEK
ncbi:ankyrin repeat domain-containing protein 13A isoform X3 [Hemicordylus capensis]|uniref:ankyrin repeat domain-containing protein 13A isoform X3 n=1 Tax=Hemicordylus capensis TaxID=884348 RepID=UPI002302880C|nr:ankyrin repeat domain-containing protein 13A isoform X3 [Hemicordylus capensis]